MESPRRPTFQSTKSQEGLSDWSSKIQELRKLVDADEETEQKKLEEEIASSRLARLRRSRVGRTNSVDLGTRSFHSKHLSCAHIVSQHRTEILWITLQS